MAFDWSAIATAANGFIGGIINHFDNKALREAQTEASLREYKLGQENLAFNREAAMRNFQLQQQAFNYQQQLNQMQMDREDNAMQRRVADLKKAGLSPLMASEGAQAGNLLSGSAPQLDVSGINNAANGLMSAHRDYATRKLQETQFKLQSRLQLAQLSADLLGAMQQYQKNKLDYEYQKGLNEFVSIHGYRDLNWRSELIQEIEKLIGKFNMSSLGDKVQNGLDLGKQGLENLINGLGNLIKVPDFSEGPKLPEEMSKGEKFAAFGIVNPKSKYGHMLDDYNYDNNRPTWQYLKEEIKEKILKDQLRKENLDETAAKLYDTDDYLKKHISKEDWLKTSWEFRKNYLKYGYFK